MNSSIQGVPSQIHRLATTDKVTRVLFILRVYDSPHIFR